MHTKNIFHLNLGFFFYRTSQFGRATLLDGGDVVGLSELEMVHWESYGGKPTLVETSSFCKVNLFT